MNRDIKSDMKFEDELDVLIRLYGKTKFQEIWESCKPKVNTTNIDYGKIVCFGTSGEIK